MDEQPPGSGREEGIIVAADLVAYAVHGVGDLVVCMARNVLAECGRIHFAAGAPLPLGQSLHSLEDVVRNGHGGLHTRSITGVAGVRARKVRTGGDAIAGRCPARDAEG